MTWVKKKDSTPSNHSTRSSWELHAASPDILVDAELLEGAILESGKALLGERRQAVAVAHHQAHAVVLALWVGGEHKIHSDT